MVAVTTGSLMWPYIYGRRVQRVKELWIVWLLFEGGVYLKKYVEWNGISIWDWNTASTQRFKFTMQVLIHSKAKTKVTKYGLHCVFTVCWKCYFWIPKWWRSIQMFCPPCIDRLIMWSIAWDLKCFLFLKAYHRLCTQDTIGTICKSTTFRVQIFRPIRVPC